MKTYIVAYTVSTSNVQVEVEAENEDEAIEAGEAEAIDIASGGWLAARSTDCVEKGN